MSNDEGYPRERVALRMPEVLKVRLQASARRNGQTLNAEIVARIIQSYGDEIDSPIPDLSSLPRRTGPLETRVRDLEETVDRLAARLNGLDGGE